jgi:hypothetical protein
MTMPLEVHPLAGIFPMMSEDEYYRLKEDIRRTGLRLPLTLYEGKILDGRNRYSACCDLGIEPATVEFTGPGTAVAFVTSMNLHRRHLNDIQRAMVAARLAQSRWRKVDGVEISTVTQKAAAKLLNISRDSVCAARKILSDGTPEEVASADAGTAPLNVLMREINHGVPPEQRSIKRKRHPRRPETSKMGAAVLARIAEEEKAKQEKAARRKPKLVTLHGKPVAAPPRRPILPALSFSEAIAALIRMTRSGFIPFDAAKELKAKEIRISEFERLLEWLMDIMTELQDRSSLRE